MPTLGRSPWWLDATGSADAIREGERIVVRPAGSLLSPNGGRMERDGGGGLYAAVNTGLRAAGDWVFGTYLNDDDRLIAAGIERARTRLAGDSRLGAVFGRVHLIDRHGARLGEIPVARRGLDLGPLLAAGIVPLAQPGTIFRREMFEELGGFDPAWRAAGDMEFFMRAWRAGWRFEFVDASLAEFRLHPGQISQRSELVDRERLRLIQRARENAPWRKAANGAVWRFRLANAGLYFSRLRRHGFASMETLYRSGGRS